MPVKNGISVEVEIEWQFDALDLRPVERWLADFALPTEVRAPGTAAAPHIIVEKQRPKRLVDEYVDTADWRIGRSGFVLRIRKRTGGSEVTLKDTSPADGGLRRRLEVTEPLPTAGVASLGPEGPVGRRLRALVGKRALQHVLEVRTRRRPYLLRVDGEPVAEVALDDTVIDVADGVAPVRLRRVEVEVQAAWMESAATLVARLRGDCGLQPATLSKFEAGLLASGRRIPGSPDLGPCELTPKSTVGEVAFVVLRRNLTSMLAHEAGTRLGEDPESLHDMRVATRRMRAALAMFRDVLPVRAANIRVELGWLADVLGAVRDIDVQIERVGQWMSDLPERDRQALADLASLLDTERGEARASLLEALDSARYERLIRVFTSLLRQGPSRRSAAARAHAVMVVPDLIKARHRAVVKAARRTRRFGAAEDFHQLRIRCKRLRYAIEFAAEVYPGETGRYVRQVSKVQDVLGLMQDAEVAVARLHALATDESAPLSRAAIFTMGAVAERYRLDAARQRATVPKHMDRLTGSTWHHLVGHLDRRRADMVPTYGWPSRPGPPAAGHEPGPEGAARA